MSNRSARFAGTRDLRALLTPDYGAFLGYHGFPRRALLSDHQGHILVVAPNRAGKGVGLLMQNALSWPTSMIILDPKGEFRATTLHWRAQYQEQCFTWGPTTFSTRWNPLAEIAALAPANQMEEAMRLAAAFSASSNGPSSGNDAFWNAQGDTFLAHAFLWAATARDDECATLAHVYDLLARPDDLNTLLRTLRDSPRDELATWAQSTLGNTESVTANTITTARNNLRSFASSKVRDATSASEFTYDQLMQPRRTLYLHATATDFRTHGQLLTAFLEGFVGRVLQDHGALEEPLLLLLDEFSLLPALPSLSTLLTLSSGYNLRLIVVLQALSQVPPDIRNILTNNCFNQVYFAARDTQTLDELAKKLGTVWRKSVSKSRNRSGSSRSESERKDDLLAPHQIREMKKALLFHGQAPAARINLRPFFNDKRFVPRVGTVLPPTPTPLTPKPLATFLASTPTTARELPPASHVADDLDDEPPPPDDTDGPGVAQYQDDDPLLDDLDALFTDDPA